MPQNSTHSRIVARLCESLRFTQKTKPDKAKTEQQYREIRKTLARGSPPGTRNGHQNRINHHPSNAHLRTSSHAPRTDYSIPDRGLVVPPAFPTCTRSWHDFDRAPWAAMPRSKSRYMHVSKHDLLFTLAAVRLRDAGVTQLPLLVTSITAMNPDVVEIRRGRGHSLAEQGEP